MQTTLLLANFATKQLPDLRARGFPSGVIVEVVLLAVPFIAALTIPMAVFLAVLWVFTPLGRELVLAAARGERHGIRRLVAPVLTAAGVVAVLTLASNNWIVPRANERLAVVRGSGTHERGDRELTIGELRTATRDARADAGAEAFSRAAYYEVEIQKKYAISAASLVLALTGVALALLFPRGGVLLVIGAGYAVSGMYYACLIAGEALADRLLVSPFVAMWLANALLLAPALLVMLWRSRPPRAPRGAESVAVGA